MGTYKLHENYCITYKYDFYRDKLKCLESIFDILAGVSQGKPEKNDPVTLVTDRLFFHVLAHMDHQYFMCNMKENRPLLCVWFVISHPKDRKIYMI